MRRNLLLLLLSGVALFSLATGLERQRLEAGPASREPASALDRLLGEGRRLFATHVFLQADVYMHQGYYPSIFEESDAFKKEHEAVLAHEAGHGGADESSGHVHHAGCNHPSHGRKKGGDWIQVLNGHFHFSEHRHLEAGEQGEAREMLPWIELAAQLDPGRAETYSVGAYWLERLGRTRESIEFLRRGLRESPRNPLLLMELGAVFFRSNDAERARHLLETALEELARLPDAGSTRTLQTRVLVFLASLEYRAGRLPKALEHLEQLRGMAEARESVEQQIRDIRAELEAANQ